MYTQGLRRRHEFHFRAPGQADGCGMSARVRITRTREGAIVLRTNGLTFVDPPGNSDSFVVAADGRLGVEDDHGVFRWCGISDGKLVPSRVVVRAGSDAPVMNLSEVFQAIRRMPAIKLG